MNDQMKELVRDMDKKEIDYETVPVLKRYKIEALRQILKENVDRKYKISFFKGC